MVLASLDHHGSSGDESPLKCKVEDYPLRQFPMIAGVELTSLPWYCKDFACRCEELHCNPKNSALRDLEYQHLLYLQNQYATIPRITRRKRLKTLAILLWCFCVMAIIFDVESMLKPRCRVCVMGGSLYRYLIQC